MTSEARKAVRSDGELPPAARLLFEEIWEMHHASEEGCYAEDEYLSDQIGAAESSVRRYRKQLREAGYITEQKSGGRRRLVPIEVISTDQDDQSCTANTDQSDQNCTDDDQSCTDEMISSDQHISSSNPEGASSRARKGSDRWAFLPSYRLRHLSEIKQEAGSPDHNPDVLSIARRYLGQDENDLASVVDFHLGKRPENQVIAAYVIAGREADSPLEYADKIIREGWKESRGGDGAPPGGYSGGKGHIEQHGDDPVVHFGQAPSHA